MTLVSRTKEISDLRKMSLKEVASKAGLAENSIYRWDTNTPKADNLAKVAKVLNVSVDYLLERTDDMSVIRTDNDKNDLREADRRVLSYGGKPISDEDWAIIKRILETGYAE